MTATLEKQMMKEHTKQMLHVSNDQIQDMRSELKVRQYTDMAPVPRSTN